jgi:hypothetical protein
MAGCGDESCPFIRLQAKRIRQEPDGLGACEMWRPTFQIANAPCAQTCPLGELLLRESCQLSVASHVLRERFAFFVRHAHPPCSAHASHCALKVTSHLLVKRQLALQSCRPFAAFLPVFFLYNSTMIMQTCSCHGMARRAEAQGARARNSLLTGEQPLGIQVRAITQQGTELRAALMWRARD